MKIRIEDVAQPACRMPVINNPTIYIPDHGLLAAVNYSDAKKDTNLHLVDVNALKSEKYKVPDDQYGAYGFARGADGNLYIGFFGGKIYSFNMATRTFSFLAHPFPDRLIWGGGASKDGEIYMGVYSTGEFCEYDIVTGRCDIFAPMPKDNLGHYAAEFAELPDGRMLVFIYGAKPTFVIYNPAKKQIEKTYGLDLHEKASRSLGVLDDDRVIFSSGNAIKLFNHATGRVEGNYVEDIPESFHYLQQVNGSYTAVGLSIGGMYRFKKNSVSVLKEKLKDNNIPSGGVHALDSHAYACLGDNGLFTKFDVESGKEENLQIQNETNCGMNLQMFRKDPGSSLVVGSHFINSQIFSLNLETNESVSSLSKVVTYPGQINCATFINNMCYLGAYGHANILAYDPRVPFACNKNPRLIASAGHEQNRPVNIVNDGRLVYMATKANYQTLGGAITVLNPDSGKIEVYRDFVKSHNPTSVFYHDAGFLVGTTQTFGDMKSHAALDKNAVVYVWDTKKRQTIHASFPWESDSLPASALSPEGIMIGFKEGCYYLFNMDGFSCKTVKSDLRSVSGGLFLDSKRFLGSCRYSGNEKQVIFILDINSNAFEELCPAMDTRLFEMISAREILVNYHEYQIKKLVLE